MSKNMTKEEFKQERDKFERLTLINDDNLLDMARERPYIHAKYINLYNTELQKSSRLKNKLDKLHAKLFKEIKYDRGFNWGTKGEIENQMFLEPVYYELKKQYDFQKLVTDFYEQCIDIIKSISFDIKNYTEYNMFLMGR